MGGAGHHKGEQYCRESFWYDAQHGTQNFHDFVRWLSPLLRVRRADDFERADEMRAPNGLSLMTLKLTYGSGVAGCIWGPTLGAGYQGRFSEVASKRGA